MYLGQSVEVHLGLLPVVGVVAVQLCLHVRQLSVDGGVVTMAGPQRHQLYHGLLVSLKCSRLDSSKFCRCQIWEVIKEEKNVGRGWGNGSKY